MDNNPLVTRGSQSHVLLELHNKLATGCRMLCVVVLL